MGAEGRLLCLICDCCCLLVYRDGKKRGKVFELLVLSVALLATGLGLYTHFYADWTQYEGEEGNKAYKLVCDYVQAESLKENCPSIFFDYIFLTTTVIGCLVAIFAYFWTLEGDASFTCRVVVKFLHCWTSVHLVVGAALYIFAAWQISKLSDKVSVGDWPGEDELITNLKYGAAAFAILQAILHVFLPRRQPQDDIASSTGSISSTESEGPYYYV